MYIFGTATVTVVYALWVSPTLREVHSPSGRPCAFNEVLIKGKHRSETGASGQFGMNKKYTFLTNLVGRDFLLTYSHNTYCAYLK
jgi:hypothetical protein